MANNNRRYYQMARFLKTVLLADTAVFILSLLFAGMGIAWLRVILRILCILCSAAALALLYMNKELLRPRSRWISVGFAAILVCVLVSTICGYPAPYISPITGA